MIYLTVDSVPSSVGLVFTIARLVPGFVLFSSWISPNENEFTDSPSDK